MSKTIRVKNAPNFDLPFSHAIKVENFVYVSGQVGVNPQTLEIIGESIEEQTEQCIKNIETILQAENLTLNHIIKMNVFVTNTSDIPKFNHVYKRLLKRPFPTRTTVQGDLGEYLIEIDCIAYCKSERYE